MDTLSPTTQRLPTLRSRAIERRPPRQREGDGRAIFPRRVTGRQVAAPPCRANVALLFDEPDAFC